MLYALINISSVFIVIHTIKSYILGRSFGTFIIFLNTKNKTILLYTWVVNNLSNIGE